MRILVSRLLILACVILYAGCSGGNFDGGVGGTSSTAAGLNSTAAESMLDEAAVPQVTQLLKLSEVRVSRTQWRYTFSLRIKNGPYDAAGVRVTLQSAPANVVIVRGSSWVGNIPARSIVDASETIVLTIDRSVPFDQAKLAWKFEYGPLQTAVQIDPAVPTDVVKQVKVVSSLAGEAVLGASLALPSMPLGARALIVALNSEGEVHLGGYTRSFQTVLNAESTAEMLVGLSLGGFLSNRGALSSADEIKSIPAFPHLVRTIRETFEAGIAPAQSREVSVALAEVVNALALKLVATQGEDRARILSIAPDRAEGPTFTLHAGRYFPEYLLLAATGASGNSVELINSMPIAWAAQTFSPDGLPLDPGSPPTVLPPNSIEAILMRQVMPWNNLGTTAVPATGTAGMTVKLAQTVPSEIRTVTSILVNVLNSLVSVSQWPEGEATCLSNSLSILQGVQYDVIFNKASFADVINDLLRPTELGAIVDTLQKCGARTATESIVASSLKTSLSFALKAGDAFNMASVVGQVFLASAYHKQSFDVGLCRTAEGRLSNCVAQLKFSPAERLIVKGATINLLDALAASDRFNNPTAFPGGLVFSRNFTDFVTVNASGSVEAVAHSFPFVPTTVSALDPATGVRGSVDITVAVAQVSPSSASIRVGEDIALRLVDPYGRQVEIPSGSQWKSNDESVLIVNIFGGTQDCPACVSFRGRSSGRAIVTATFKGSVLGNATIDVASGLPDDVCPLVAPCSTAPAPFDASFQQRPGMCLVAGRTYTMNELFCILPGSSTVYIGGLFGISGTLRDSFGVSLSPGELWTVPDEYFGYSMAPANIFGLAPSCGYPANSPVPSITIPSTYVARAISINANVFSDSRICDGRRGHTAGFERFNFPVRRF
jgi:hypothetical protein